jgi:hypothetical protein
MKKALLTLALLFAPVAALAQTPVIGIVKSNLTWNAGYFAGTFGGSTATSLGATWKPAQSIIINQLSVTVGTAPATCSPYPVVGIYDATTSTWIATLTLASGTYSYYSTGLGIVVAAGDQLRAGVQTAGGSCGTNPGSGQITVGYTSQ